MKKNLSQSATNENAGKRLARLAAVQGLYQIALTKNTAEHIIRDFHNHPPEQSVGEMMVGMDVELFGEIVTGVTREEPALDEMLAGAFGEKISAGRVEILLRAILRAGAYELHNHAKIPTGVIINDYVDVAHAFFDAKEPGLVNAVLDKIAKGLRS